jgi:hypothetical protein
MFLTECYIQLGDFNVIFCYLKVPYDSIEKPLNYTNVGLTWFPLDIIVL